MNPVAIVVSDFVDAFIDAHIWAWNKIGEIQDGIDEKAWRRENSSAVAGVGQNA